MAEARERQFPRVPSFDPHFEYPNLEPTSCSKYLAYYCGSIADEKTSASNFLGASFGSPIVHPLGSCTMADADGKAKAEKVAAARKKVRVHSDASLGDH